MDIYKVNLSNAKTQTQLHEALRDNMAFPEFYGQNLDALWDCLTGFIDAPAHTYFYGSNSLSKELKTYFYDRIIDVFEEAKEYYGNELNKEFSFTIID